MALKSELEENPYRPTLSDDPLASDSAELAERFDDEEDYREALEIWPRCPQCGKRRKTFCPTCKALADLFPLGDAGFWTEQDADAQAPSEPRRCGNESCAHSCGAGAELIPGVPDPRQAGAGMEKTTNVFDDLADERERAKVWQEDAVAICHVCSEAFQPKFSRYCDHCGHDFQTGVEVEGSSDATSDASGSSEVDEYLAQRAKQDAFDSETGNVSRVGITTVVLAALLGALLLYFATL